MKFASGCIVLFLTALSGVASATIHPLGQQDPSGTFTQGGVSNAGRGWEFTANAAGIMVTQLGMVDYAAGTYEVDLYDAGTQAELASSVFDYAANGWRFNDLGAPVALTQGSNYLVELYTENNPNYLYDVGAPANWLPSGDIQYVNMLYCNDCAPGTYPTSSLPGSMYGIPDIGYVIGQVAAPEPASLALFGAALTGLGLTRRRRSAQ